MVSSHNFFWFLQRQACANVAGPAPIAVTKKVPKPVQKKVTVKPKPEEVIVIDEDSIDKEVQKDKKKEGDCKSKKNSQAFTSVLTARSKVDTDKTNKMKKKKKNFLSELCSITNMQCLSSY